MTDWDQVAREVLTPFLAELTEWPEAHAFGERYMQRHFPAPAALVTVTVEGVTWTKHADPDGSVWLASVGGPASRSDAEEFLDRIASDARRIEELEAANASLKAETDRISAMRQDALGELVRVGHERDEARRLYAESEGELVRVVHERDEARRALALANDNTRLWRERVNGLGASTTEKGHVERSSTSAPAHTATSQGEGLGKITGAEQVAAEEPGDSRVTVEAAPAPIPLGAQRRWLLVVDAEGIAHECAEANEMEQALRDLQDVERTYHEQGRVVPVIEAVADAATVERVESEIANAFADCMGVMGVTPADMDPTRKRAYAHAALRALGYTIQEGANG